MLPVNHLYLMPAIPKVNYSVEIESLEEEEKIRKNYPPEGI